MKHSIRILTIVSIIFLVSFSTYAQADNWSGAWNTKYGKVTISKNANGYTGTFRYGKLTEGREQNGMLLGRYTRNSRTPLNSSLGNKGEFKFILSADKTKFDGYHKSETDSKWRSDNWNGVKIWGTVLPVIVTSNLPSIATPTWTGTWESPTGDVFKILDNTNKIDNISKVFAKISVKVDGITKSYNVKGYFLKDNPEKFEGTMYLDNGWDVGFLKIEYGLTYFNDFKGYMWFAKDDSKHNISAHRTSTAKPTVKIF